MAMTAYEKKQAEKERKKVRDLCIDGLLTDGAHHKQWILEQVLEAIGEDLGELRKEIERQGYSWEEGIAP